MPLDLVFLDDMTGANDDLKWDQAFTAARQANGYTKTVVLPNRQVTLNAQHQWQTGDALSGPLGQSADEARSSGNHARVRCNFAGSQFTIPANFTHSVSIHGVQWEGTANTIWMSNPRGIGMQTWHIENCSFSAFKHVLGTPTVLQEMTACTFSGYWNVNGSYDQAFTIGGSDNRLWTDGMLLDSPPTRMGTVGNKQHLNLNFMEFATVGPIYITGETHSNLQIDSYGMGNAGAHGLIITGMVATGRNAGQPTLGANVRINGGMGTIRDGIFGWAMTNPTATGRGDLGVIHINSGDWLIDAASYGRATGVAETVPFIYVGPTARVRVSNIRRSGAWTGLPIVKVAAGGSLKADDTVTVT